LSRFLATLWMILTAPMQLIRWLLGLLGGALNGLTAPLRGFLEEEPEDVPLGETLQRAVQNPMGALEHLDALRKHLLRAVIFLAVACVLAFNFTPQIMDWLAQPIGGIEELRAIEVTEPVGVVMRVTLLTGFAVSLPYIIFELLLFAAPGLSRRARLIGLFAVPLVAVFFVGGMAFAYFYMLPPALDVLLEFMGIQTQVRPASYLRFTTGLMFWIGLFFEFPLITYVLTSMGILRAKILRDQWRLAVVIMSVVAAAITPTIDPINMMLVLLPLILLYFLSIGLAYLAESRRKARREAD